MLRRLQLLVVTGSFSAWLDELLPGPSGHDVLHRARIAMTSEPPRCRSRAAWIPLLRPPALHCLAGRVEYVTHVPHSIR